MAYKDKIEAIRSELRVMHKAVPGTMSGFSSLSKAVSEAGPLDRKQMEFIALGMALVQRCEPCVVLHVEGVMKAGGTREELASVLAMAVQMSGGPGMMYAAHALACWDELSAAVA